MVTQPVNGRGLETQAAWPLNLCSQLSPLSNKRTLNPIQGQSLAFSPSLPQESIETMRTRLERSIQVLTLHSL